MNLTRHEVETALNAPRLLYPSPVEHGAGNMVAVQGRLAVAHNPIDRVVLTILWDGKTGRDVDG